MLELFHPEIARRSCDDCRQWQYDDSEDGSKQVQVRAGQKLKRLAPTPCELHAKNPKCNACPKGHWESPLELSERNREAWEHFKRCRATGRFPDDPLVAHHAATLIDIVKVYERKRYGRNNS